MIPEMTDRLGKYWDQPKDIRSAPLDGKHAILTPRQVKELAEYSSTVPSGVYPGKCWKRIERGKAYLAWYGVHPTDPNLCTISFREILVVEPANG